MKKIINFALVLVFAAIAVSCSEADNDSVGNTYLDVTPNNISGVWSMESFDNGKTLEEGTYRYIVFNRKDRTFVSYDNLGSMGTEAHKRSGRYSIDVDGSAIIRGLYDFGQGDWEHRYYVRDLTNSRMVWVAVDDANQVQVYVRAELPEWLNEEND